MSHRGPEPNGLPGFGHFRYHWDPKWQRYNVKVAPGEIFLSRDNIVITTVLGSCVSACITDSVVGIGAMNHFMLPTSSGGTNGVSRLARFGSYAMEQLINEMLKFGCVKDNMQVKVTGGGNIMGGGVNVGVQNTQFVIDYLRDEGLQIVSADLGGSRARKVVYFPLEGRLMVRKLEPQSNNALIEEERQYQTQVERQLDESDVELF